MGEVDVEALGLEPVPEVDGVAEPLRAEQADGRAAALDQGVRRDRRSMHEERGLPEEALELEPKGFGDRGQTLLDGGGRPVRR